jgi:hypothetical protein
MEIKDGLSISITKLCMIHVFGRFIEVGISKSPRMQVAARPFRSFHPRWHGLRLQGLSISHIVGKGGVG